MNLNFCLRAFRACCAGKNKPNNKFHLLKVLEKKFNKVTSYEHFIKISKDLKLIKNIVFDDYQKQLFKLCKSSNQFKKKVNLSVKELSKKLSNSNKEQSNKIDVRIYESLQS